MPARENFRARCLQPPAEDSRFRRQVAPGKTATLAGAPADVPGQTCRVLHAEGPEGAGGPLAVYVEKVRFIIEAGIVSHGGHDGGRLGVPERLCVQKVRLKLCQNSMSVKS